MLSFIDIEASIRVRVNIYSRDSTETNDTLGGVFYRIHVLNWSCHAWFFYPGLWSGSLFNMPGWLTETLGWLPGSCPSMLKYGVEPCCAYARSSISSSSSLSWFWCLAEEVPSAYFLLLRVLVHACTLLTCSVAATHTHLANKCDWAQVHMT